MKHVAMAACFCLIMKLRILSGYITRVLAVVVVVSLFAGFFPAATMADTSTDAAIAARQAALQTQLDQILQQIDAEQQILSTEQQKGESIQRDVNILDAQIKTSQLNIQAHEIAIEGLGKDIVTKTDTINQLTGKIQDTDASVAQLIRSTNELDSYTLPDIVFSDKDISSFFQDLDAYGSIKQSILVALGAIKQTQQDTETAKETLNKQRLQEIDAKTTIQQEQDKIKVNEKEKSRLLSLSKAQQKTYASDIASRQAQAAVIRSALFALNGAAAIPFGKALDYANQASKSTGVPPAFLLAILTQESELGKNVGTCNRPGDPPSKSWKVIMKPSRDQGPYLQITSALGLNPDTMPLSCPMGSGYGGAMGPAQFIPSTWLLFQSRIAAALNISVPNPWNPPDAFMASALYLGDLGADSTSYSADRNAACRYYSGRSCDSKKPANSFYGDQVMAKMQSIQTTMIDPLNGV